MTGSGAAAPDLGDVDRLSGATLQRRRLALDRHDPQGAGPPPQSTAAIACAVRSTLALFSPATHIRPERTR